MRKHVTPADPNASIPDPARGRDLPPEGAAVTWDAYWAGRAARGEVEAVEIADEPEPGEVLQIAHSPTPEPVEAAPDA